MRAFLSPNDVPSAVQVSGRVCRRRGRSEDCYSEGCSCRREDEPGRPGDSNVEEVAGLEEDSMRNDVSVQGLVERDQTCL